MERTTSEAVLQIIDDVVKYFNLERDRFLLFISDAASYMLNVATLLKQLYSNLKHLTCLSHLLHNCAEKVRAEFPKTDFLIASIKAATVKNRTRSAAFEAIGQPPQPVLTRWASWLEAAFYYSRSFHEVKEIVENFEDDQLLVERAKQSVNDCALITELILICSYQPMVSLVKQFENREATVESAWISLQQFIEELSGIDPAGILEYLKRRLESMVDLKEIVEGSGNLSPARYFQLRNVQPSSGDVERSFSKLNFLLTDDLFGLEC